MTTARLRKNLPIHLLYSRQVLYVSSTACVPVGCCKMLSPSVHTRVPHQLYVPKGCRQYTHITYPYYRGSNKLSRTFPTSQLLPAPHDINLRKCTKCPIFPA